MFAQFYERKITTGKEKPMLDKIMALKQDVASKGKAIKILYLTDEEFSDLDEEFTKLKEVIKATKNSKSHSGVEAFLGVSIEIVNEIGHESVDKVA